MKEKKIKMLSKKYCRSEKFILLLIKICEDNNIYNIEEKISNYLDKVCQNGVSI